MHVLDEAHRYMRSALSADIIETFRDVRHRRLQVVVASQDPLSVPRQVIDLASQVVLHRCDAPDWLRHIARSNVAMRHVSSQEVAALGVGEAIVISRQASHPSAAGRPFRVYIRPRVTMHGGHTLRVA